MTDKSFIVPATDRGQTLAAVLKRRLAISWSQARQLIDKRLVKLAGAPCVEATRRVQAGQKIDVLAESKRKRTKSAGVLEPRPALPSVNIRHCDDHILVVDKPAGLTTMRHAEEEAEFGPRGRRYLPTTLADLLPRLVGKRTPFFAVHRIDRDTTGLVVFARTKEAERHLGRQFRAHAVERKYLALVRGKPPSGTIESVLVRDRGDGRRGSASGPQPGQRAVTHVRVVEELGPLALIECQLETGRTHQVRIHLGEAGAPLCGDTVYDRPAHGRPAPDPSGASRVLLHAAHLGLQHPATGRRLEWHSPLPDDMTEVMARFRGRFESTGDLKTGK